MAKYSSFGPSAAIFLDLDGTISDPREGIVRCLQYALKKLGRTMPPEKDLLCYIGPPLYESFAALLDSKDVDLVKRAVALYRERFVADGMFENRVYVGIPDALQELTNARYRLYVVTSKPMEFARKIINHFGLERFFHKIYGSEPEGARSDKRTLIAYVLEQEQIKPTEALMIGDREHDIKGALANGVFPIGVLWGYGSRQELFSAGATVLCESPGLLATGAIIRHDPASATRGVAQLS